MNKPVRSLLLAAGLGTRLRPLTLNTPKCLVEIKGKPLLGDWLDKLEKINTQKVLINTHHLAGKVNKFIKNQTHRKIKIDIFHEEKLLGTAGTLYANKSFFRNSLGIFIHADNFTNFDLNDLIEAHNMRPSYCLITMLTFTTLTPENCGIVKVDQNKVVQRFFEKSTNFHGNIANGAIYMFEDEFLSWLEKNSSNASDFSTQVIPKLMGRIYTFHINQPYLDIGTVDALREARKLAENL